jgi:hypothetical protein
MPEVFPVILQDVQAHGRPTRGNFFETMHASACATFSVGEMRRGRAAMTRTNDVRICNLQSSASVVWLPWTATRRYAGAKGKTTAGSLNICALAR